MTNHYYHKYQKYRAKVDTLTKQDGGTNTVTIDPAKTNLHSYLTPSDLSSYSVSSKDTHTVQKPGSDQDCLPNYLGNHPKCEKKINVKKGGITYACCRPSLVSIEVSKGPNGDERAILENAELIDRIEIKNTKTIRDLKTLILKKYNDPKWKLPTNVDDLLILIEKVHHNNEDEDDEDDDDDEVGKFDAIGDDRLIANLEYDYGELSVVCCNARTLRLRIGRCLEGYSDGVMEGSFEIGQVEIKNTKTIRDLKQKILDTFTHVLDRIYTTEELQYNRYNLPKKVDQISIWVEHSKDLNYDLPQDDGDWGMKELLDHEILAEIDNYYGPISIDDPFRQYDFLFDVVRLDEPLVTKECMEDNPKVPWNHYLKRIYDRWYDNKYISKETKEELIRYNREILESIS